MMTNLVLTKTRMRAGVWEGVLTGAGETAPVLTLRHNGDLVSGLSLTATEDGAYHVQAPVPVDRIADDVQTFAITDGDNMTVLASFVIFAGEQLEDDLRAEVDLLRAELDLLKRAFRKHCIDTA
jgi:hypothetical protein